MLHSSLPPQVRGKSITASLSMWLNLELTLVRQEAKSSSSSFYYYQKAQYYEENANEADLEGVRGTRNFDLSSTLPDKLYKLIKMLLHTTALVTQYTIFLPIYNT